MSAIITPEEEAAFRKLTKNAERDQLGNVPEPLTLAKSLPPNGLDAGVYRVTIKINDRISNQTISPAAQFVVE